MSKNRTNLPVFFFRSKWKKLVGGWALAPLNHADKPMPSSIIWKRESFRSFHYHPAKRNLSVPYVLQHRSISAVQKRQDAICMPYLHELILISMLKCTSVLNIPNQYPTLCLQLFTYIYHFSHLYHFFLGQLLFAAMWGNLYLGKKSDGFRNRGSTPRAWYGPLGFGGGWSIFLDIMGTGLPEPDLFGSGRLAY